MIFRREPVLIQTAFIAGLNVLTAFGVLNLTCGQAGALAAALAGVLGLVTRRLVTPLNDPRDAHARQLVPQQPPAPGDARS